MPGIVPPEEAPVLEALITIRMRLTALKKDRHEHVKAQAVQSIYEQVVAQVETLNKIREDASAKQAIADGQDAAASKATAGEMGELNRVDFTLADVFQLLSLFFLTIGKNRESPATYCQLATLKRLLDHMSESGVYMKSDLNAFQERLVDLKAIIDRTADAPDALRRILLRKYNACQRVWKKLYESLDVLSQELIPVHQRLIQIRRKLAAAAARPKTIKNEVENLQEDLRQIDARRVDGKFVGTDPTAPVPAGQALCAGLLEENFDICLDISSRQDVAIPLQPIYERLCEMRSQLERLVLTHRWTLRETDLYNFQVSLAELDGMRVDGKFVDAEGKKPEGQLALLYLLRRCYGLIYKLMASSEPIAEELMPIANKLSTIKRCLVEIQRVGGPYSPRDLYPYALALSQIDSRRVDGKFLASDGSVPEGQAIVFSCLAESYELLNGMREEEEEQQQSDGVVDSDGPQ